MLTEQDTQQELTRIAVQACRELFQAYGVRIDTATADRAAGEELLFCGVVGFVGSSVRGMCLLAATEPPLVDSCPAGGSLRDWLGELTNQLVGRIKAKLLARGVEIGLTTPIVLHGEHIAPLPRRLLNPEVLSSEDGRILIWLETEVAPGFRLGEESPHAPPAREGDALLF